MKPKHLLVVGVVVLGLAALGSMAARAEDGASQALKGSATTFELKMRILEGSREAPVRPAKPVTASYLRFQNFVNFDAPEDVQVEQQIKKLYSLKELSLTTEAPLVWEKGKSEKALHMFRLNGQEYLVLVTPGRLIAKNQFRIEVYEQSSEKKTNLLDTEFSLPDKSAAVFGFENTEAKPYFITLRLSSWGGVLGGVVGGVVGAISGDAGDKVKPPKIIKQVDPVYPEEARKAGVEGVVILEATTDIVGRVAAVRVLRSIPLLDQAAVDAVKQWVYEPMVINGKPRPVVLTITVRFDLDSDKGVRTYSGSEVSGVGAGSNVMPPKLIKQVDPVYPEIARQARVEGAVILEATTDTYGNIAGIKVLRSIPLLDQAAIDAVKQWVYEPMVIDGKPQPSTFTVTVQFKLGDKKAEVGGVVGGIIGGVTGGIEGGVKGGVQGGVAGGVEGGVEGGVTGGVKGGVKGGVAQTEDLKAFEKGAVRAVGKIGPPKRIKEVAPVYPEVARQARVEGTVILEIKADEKGNIVDARVLRSIPLLDQAAVDAVKQWKYEPLVIDGKPRQVIFTATVRFMFKEGDKAKTIDKFAQGAVKAEGEVQPPKLLKEIFPVYPEVARQAHVQGTVILSVKTNEAGRVVDAIVLRSIPLLDQAAIDAVRQWVYEPKIINGKAAPIVFTVTVQFQLK